MGINDKKRYDNLMGAIHKESNEFSPEYRDKII